MFLKVGRNTFRAGNRRCFKRFGLRFNSTVSGKNPNSSSKAFGYAGVGVLSAIGGLYLGKNWLQSEPKKTDHQTEEEDPSTLPLNKLSSPVYADEEAFNKALSAIKAVVGDDKVSDDKLVVEAHSDSFFSTHHPPNPQKERPQVVVCPQNTEQVSQIMKIAHEYRVPIVANSGMTSLEGHNMHTRGPYSVSLSFEDMDQVLAAHPDDLDIVVQPGLGWQELDEYLLDNDETSHLMFGPDPGIGACIGGMVSTSCSGTNAYRYGTMKENVVNLTVVLADGTVVKTKQRPRKSSAGYDTTRLFIGAEGTLGIITEITLKLSVRPIKQVVSIVTFPTIKDAAATARYIISKSGMHLDAIELLNPTVMSFVNETAKETDSRTFREKPTLLLKVGGSTDAAIDEQIGLITKIAKDNELIEIETSKSEDDNLVLWTARRNGLWSTIEYGRKILEDKNDVQIWTTDIAVPISKLDTVISETNDDLNASGFENKFSVLGHVGDGNCHFLILYNSKDYGQVQDVVDRMVHRALHYEGTCTGEHGVGVGKRKYLNEELGTSTVNLMREIKLLLDPRRILNPDKIFKIDPKDNLDQLLSSGHIREHGKPC